MESFAFEQNRNQNSRASLFLRPAEEITNGMFRREVRSTLLTSPDLNFHEGSLLHCRAFDESAPFYRRRGTSHRFPSSLKLTVNAVRRMSLRALGDNGEKCAADWSFGKSSSTEMLVKIRKQYRSSVFRSPFESTILGTRADDHRAGYSRIQGPGSPGHGAILQFGQNLEAVGIMKHR